MTHSPIFIGKTEFHLDDPEIKGQYLEIDGERFYRISNYDRMRPFFMTVVSDSDHWLFTSSNGGLTAGRKNPENALFPYYSDDKIHDSGDLTGSKTIVLVKEGSKTHLWEPFSGKYEGAYALQRNLYKNVTGNKLIFEENNLDLGLTFNYGWFFSDKFGFVRKSRISNTGSKSASIDIIDGIQNLLPYGVDLTLQTQSSTLIDAYKKNELIPETNLGIYRLSSIPVDKAEPSEALTATTVWSYGLDDPGILLCSLQIDLFRKGRDVVQETDIRAERGAYFVNSRFKVDPGSEKSWYIVAELGQGAPKVVALNHFLEGSSDIPDQLEADIARGTKNLTRIVASSDGMQHTADACLAARHFSNVLYNVMRGGVFADNYYVGKRDLIRFLSSRNQPLATKYHSVLDELPSRYTYTELLSLAKGTNDPDLIRLSYEYLPIFFSRRHGDPSRPWNHFSIEVKDEDGSQVLSYQGNWRDIFQNWEALGLSFPGFIESMICKFVNASTIDGYNPYRITREGIDWEVVEPENPWSYIGYWGDHQIIYLLKLLEICHDHHPQNLNDMLTQRIFSFANVPYRIKAYEALLEDPFNTVDFDENLEDLIHDRVEGTGADGRLIWDTEDKVFNTNLTEKLLIPVLAKFTNFIPEGGIWLNTQRPEWNDANNALVGRGVSMVTLYYMRRYQTFLADLLKNSGTDIFVLSSEIAALLQSVTKTFRDFEAHLSAAFSDQDRKAVLDLLGEAGSQYREKLYQDGPSGQTTGVNLESVLEFINLSLDFIDHTIRANKRADGLYHAYNLMTVNGAEVSVDYLYEMLEGQVAVLSSGLLRAAESLEVLRALRKSALFREDQHSYILYPNRRLQRFMEKNIIPSVVAENSKLIKQVIADGNTRLVEKDIAGAYHFNNKFRNAEDVKKALAELRAGEYSTLVESEEDLILEIFESLFDHKSFTGRSGTFYGYEGLGSIYWHMVSKLLLAAMEVCQRAIDDKEDPSLIEELVDCYYDIRQGIGFNKTPEEYGAFPSDAYSHTPGNTGAQQPGMTGQVKEDILVMFGELGARVSRGRISFEPSFLKKEEFLSKSSVFSFVDIGGEEHTIKLKKGSLAFTYCQVPVIYILSDTKGVRIFKSDGTSKTVEGNRISQKDSTEIFYRTGQISKIEVKVVL